MDDRPLTELIRAGLKDPLRGVSYVTNPIRKSVLLTLSSRYPLGKNIFTEDWELLIVLDTCRPDVLREVAPEYSFLNESDIDDIWSVGGSTLEWTSNTFVEEHRNKIESTALISANGWPHRIIEEGFRPEDRFNSWLAMTDWKTVPSGTLGKHIPAWQYGEGRAGYSDQPQADANTVVDFAIDVGREGKYDRVIAHVIEPHYPFAAAAKARGAKELNQSEQKPWHYLRDGGGLEVVWNNYLTELRYGLDHVERLLENFDAEKAVITADHGELFGEWKMYGHDSGSLMPQLRRVPWVETTATDSGTHQTEKRTQQQRTVEENLESLGYL